MILNLILATITVVSVFSATPIAAAPSPERLSILESTMIEHSVVSAGLGTRTVFGKMNGVGVAGWNWQPLDHILIGLSVESMINSKKVALPDDQNGDVSLWYLGPRIEYQFYQYKLLNVSGALTGRYGNVGYRVTDNDQSATWYTSEFWAIEPGVRVSLNYSQEVELGVEGNYSFAQGVNLIGVQNRDLSGLGANVFIARRF